MVTLLSSLLASPPRICTIFPYTSLFRSFVDFERGTLFLPELRPFAPRLAADSTGRPFERERPEIRKERSAEHKTELPLPYQPVCRLLFEKKDSTYTTRTPHLPSRVYARS